MGPIQTIDDVLGMLRRRGLLMALVIVAGGTMALLQALNLPRSYEAAAVLQVEMPRVSDEMALRGTGVAAAQQIQLIEQRLMVRDNLAALIERHGLFADAEGLSLSQKVAAMRASIRIQSITAPGIGGEGALSSLVIVVQLGTAEAAAAVANDLAAAVIDRGAAAQADRTRATLEFFASEEQRIGRAIAQLEAEITAYKDANLGALPEALVGRRLELGRLAEELREIDRQLLELRRNRDALQANPQRRAVETRQIETLEREISGLEAQKSLLQDRADDIDEAIRRSPAVESVLGTFERRLQQLQDQYVVLTRRRTEAEATQRLESDRQTARLELLEPALPPEYPMRSTRRRTLAVGLAGSIAAALGLALLLEFRNPVMRTSGQMQRALQLTPYIAIPRLDPPRRRRRRGI